jgi:hypothetical protein
MLMSLFHIHYCTSPNFFLISRMDLQTRSLHRFLGPIKVKDAAWPERVSYESLVD